MQPTLFDTNTEYIPDRFVIGNKAPYVKHPEHRNAAMRRPFIMWDGEGYTDDYGRHHYWLLANSTGEKLIAPPGRSLERSSVARLFMRTHARYDNAIHVGFALGYDFTCILRGNSLGKREYDSLYNRQYFSAEGYVWRLMMGKMLSVFEDGQTEGKFLLQDTWGFFQKKFTAALDEYFDKQWDNRDLVIEMKEQRGNFDREHDEEVMFYNDCELDLGVKLMEELRDRLYAAGMPISRWYGPGALANGLMSNWKIKDTLSDLYKELPDIAEASRYAYAGGRFELLQPGHSNRPVYQYDINSAYPWAIAQLPNLATGSWRHVVRPNWSELNEYSVVRVNWYSNLASSREHHISYPDSIPFPLWHRSPQGRISYPSDRVVGWFWSPELFAARDYCAALLGRPFTFSLEEAWVFEDDGSRPFAQVETLYRNRQKLKQMGNGAHVGIKLGLNSLYGKLAQQIGYTENNGRIPPYHNLALAGIVTSMCRGKLLSAMQRSPASIIASETDAVFSLTPLDLPISTDLGDWEETKYDDLYYFASGFRFGIRDGEVIKPATRGIPVKDIQLDTILESVRNNYSKIKVQQTQFISIRWALSMNQPQNVGQWRTFPKELQFMCEERHGKRLHDFDCPSCTLDPQGVRWYGWDKPHLTMPNNAGSREMNTPHKVAWVNGDSPDLDLLEENILFDIEG